MNEITILILAIGVIGIIILGCILYKEKYLQNRK